MDTTTPHRHPLDVLVPDPTSTPPLCGEAEFAELLDEMVAGCAPRLFAVVQEYGERVDGRIAAWGLAFDDHTDVVSTDGSARMLLESVDGARRAFAWGSHITVRLVWVSPDDGSVARER